MGAPPGPDLSKPVLRDPRTGHLLPGTRAVNPRGSAGLTLDRAIRKECDPAELARILMTIARGALPDGVNGATTVSVRDRLAAIKLICDRGWGAAVQPVVVSDGDGMQALGAIAVRDLDDTECEILERAIARQIDARMKAPAIDAVATERAPAPGAPEQKP